MTKFRPCIDLHAGQVKQIVGGTLDSASAALQTNYVSEHPASHYARLYKDNGLEGAHVIMLGAGNDQAALQALRAWPGHLQVGGGINAGNAEQWIDAGASKVRAAVAARARGGAERADATAAAGGGGSRSLSRRISSPTATLARRGWARCSRRWAATGASWSLTSAAGGGPTTAGSWPPTSGRR